MISPKKSSSQDHFLAVFQVTAGKVTSGLVPGANEVVNDENLRPGENKPD